MQIDTVVGGRRSPRSCDSGSSTRRAARRSSATSAPPTRARALPSSCTSSARAPPRPARYHSAREKRELSRVGFARRASRHVATVALVFETFRFLIKTSARVSLRDTTPRDTLSSKKRNLFPEREKSKARFYIRAYICIPSRAEYATFFHSRPAGKVQLEHEFIRCGVNERFNLEFKPWLGRGAQAAAIDIAGANGFHDIVNLLESYTTDFIEYKQTASMRRIRSRSPQPR